MKKCIMCLLVASLLCATVLTGCVDASLSGSLPSTAPGTTGTEAANPTQTKPKPTETQPNPTQTVPANPLKPRPGLVNYTSYEVLDMGKYWSIENQGCLGDAYVLSSVEECVRIVVDASDDSLEKYDEAFFKDHFLIVIEARNDEPRGVFEPLEIVLLADGGFRVELVQEVGMWQDPEHTTHCYYVVIAIEGSSRSDVQVTVNLTDRQEMWEDWPPR